MFLRKGILKICNKFTGEHPCQSVVPIKLLCNFIGIALRHACSPVNLLHIFRTPFPKNTSGGVLLKVMMNWVKNIKAYMMVGLLNNLEQNRRGETHRNKFAFIILVQFFLKRKRGNKKYQV